LQTETCRSLGLWTNAQSDIHLPIWKALILIFNWVNLLGKRITLNIFYFPCKLQEFSDRSQPSGVTIRKDCNQKISRTHSVIYGQLSSNYCRDHKPTISNIVPYDLKITWIKTIVFRYMSKSNRGRDLQIYPLFLTKTHFLKVVRLIEY